MALATFAAGCFWGPQQLFSKTPGVTATRAGYIGGNAERPTYEDVCSGRTGHAEAVEVEFDPAQISYEQLVDQFFHMHNPTQVNRQGPDVGTQYRSAVFYHDDQQRQTVEAALTKYQARFKRKIATELKPAGHFWPAEDYHQNYLDKHGMPSCHIAWE